MVSGAFTSFCLIHKMALPTAVDQACLAPSWDDEGGLLSPAAVMPRLPSNPSKSPGKKLLSRGPSAAKPTRTSGATSGCLRGPLHSNWHILPQWSVILKESSPIRVFISCWDCNSPRWNRINSSIPLRASSSQVRGRAILRWTAARNCHRAVPTTAFWEGRVVLTWVAASKSLRSLSMAASMSACHICKVSPKSSPIRTLRWRNSTISDLEGLINFPDEAHLLHPLEVEIVHLIHDLGHPHVNVLPGQRWHGRCWPGHRGKLLGRSKTLSLATDPTHRCGRLQGHGGLVSCLKEFQAARVNARCAILVYARILHQLCKVRNSCFLL